MSANARHTMTTAEWYTPDYIVDAARTVLGGTIDLDPASSAKANKRIKAKRFFTAKDDGLAQEWAAATAFINAPGGKRDGKSLPLLFWEKLLQHYVRGDGAEVIWIGYSLEQLQTFQSGGFSGPAMFPMCIPKRRIAFEGRGTSPTHANYITYLGDFPNDFEEVFSQIGEVRL